MKAATDQLCSLGYAYFISIHAAREGGDGGCMVRNKNTRGFQSTPPVKAATPLAFKLRVRLEISIHAAREGGDGSS